MKPIFALFLPLALAACGGGSTSSEAVSADEQQQLNEAADALDSNAMQENAQ